MTAQTADRFRILVVDDDREMRDSLEHLLDAAGWQVETLPSAQQVESRIAALHPDVILTDVRMPGMDGMALLRSLTERDAAGAADLRPWRHSHGGRGHAPGRL